MLSGLCVRISEPLSHENLEHLLAAGVLFMASRSLSKGSLICQLFLWGHLQLPGFVTLQTSWHSPAFTSTAIITLIP